MALKTRLSDALEIKMEIKNLELKIGELSAAGAKLGESIAARNEAVFRESSEVEAAEQKIKMLKGEMEPLKTDPEHRHRVQEGVKLENEVETKSRNVSELNKKIESLHKAGSTARTISWPVIKITERGEKMIYLTRKIPEPALQYLQERFACRFWEEENIPVPREVLRREVGEAEGLYCMLSDRIDREVIDAAPRLKVISTMAVGFDNIDVEYARQRGIIVTHTPGVLTEATADLAFALLMAAGRRLIEANRAIYRGEWKTWGPLFMAGRDIYGASLGIIGLGRIGQAMARRARGFAMKVYYFSRRRNMELEEKEGITYLPLEELLKSCDFVSLHVPAIPETTGMIGPKELAVMKPTAILINTARGTVVDENALYQALKSGTIYAAGLDVFAVEPVDPNHPLLQLPNVVALPHIGSASIETRYKMARLAAEDLLRVLNGEQPRFPVPGGLT